MTELIISILSSSVLFFIFRLFPIYKVDTAQAIVVNYFTAFICGCLVNQSFPDVGELFRTNLLPYVIAAGFLFISLFVVMGISSYQNGMGTTSVAVKMSMALSMLFFVIAYNESVTWMKISGFVLAFAGIFLITFEKNTTGKRSASLMMLLFLFIGSALLDVVLNYVQHSVLGSYPSSLFTAFGFLAAGLIGTLWMITQYTSGKRSFSWRNVAGGIILGIPNYFSIYLLIRSYSSTGWSASATLAVTGISIVSLSAIFGIVVFKESARWQKLTGLVCALVAIVLLASAST